MDPSDACSLRKVILKKRKVGSALDIKESSMVQIVATLEYESALVISSEVSTSIISNHSRVSKAGASSSVPQSVTSEEVLGGLALGSKICIFDNLEITKDIFEDFIHPVDANQVMGEGNQQHQKDIVLSVMQVSHSSYS